MSVQPTQPMLNLTNEQAHAIAHAALSYEAAKAAGTLLGKQRDAYFYEHSRWDNERRDRVWDSEESRERHLAFCPQEHVLKLDRDRKRRAYQKAIRATSTAGENGEK